MVHIFIHVKFASFVFNCFGVNLHPLAFDLQLPTSPLQPPTFVPSLPHFVLKHPVQISTKTLKGKGTAVGVRLVYCYPLWNLA
jgi:hypothetical protein